MVSEWLEKCLEAKNWTIADLARQMKLSSKTLYRTINAKTKPNPATVQLIALALDVDPDRAERYFLGRIREMPLPFAQTQSQQQSSIPTPQIPAPSAKPSLAGQEDAESEEPPEAVEARRAIKRESQDALEGAVAFDPRDTPEEAKLRMFAATAPVKQVAEAFAKLIASKVKDENYMSKVAILSSTLRDRERKTHGLRNAASTPTTKTKKR